MKVNDPEMSAKVVYSLMLSLGDELGRTILDADEFTPGQKTRTICTIHDRYRKSIYRCDRTHPGSSKRIDRSYPGADA